MARSKQQNIEKHSDDALLTIEGWKARNKILEYYRKAFLSNPTTEDEITTQWVLAWYFLEQIFDCWTQVRSAFLAEYVKQGMPDETDVKEWQAFTRLITEAATWDAAVRGVYRVLNKKRIEVEVGYSVTPELINEVLLSAAKEALRIMQREPAGYAAIIKSKKLALFDDLPEIMGSSAIYALLPFIKTQVKVSKTSPNRRLPPALGATEDTSTAQLSQQFMESLLQVLPIVCNEWQSSEQVRPGGQEMFSQKWRRSLVSRAVRTIEKEAPLLYQQLGESGEKIPAPTEDLLAQASYDPELLEEARSQAAKEIACSRLSPQERLVMELKILEGKSNNEIAEHIGRSRSQVDVIRARAFKKAPKLRRFSQQ